MRTFFLGTHRPNWLGQVDIPLMVSLRTLGGRKSFPRASAPWALDSGGFTQLSHFGSWTLSAREYVEQVRRVTDGVGMPEFIAPQDWMCEPWIIDTTGLSVAEHQRRTVENYCELRSLEPSLPFIPVLQGWSLPEYAECWRLYSEAGVDLEALPVVGLGSVCRRQDTRSAEAIVLSLQPLRLHGFGVKSDGLGRYGYLMESADSMAWSYGGRRSGTCLPTGCGNHLHYALSWRERLLRSMDYQQTHLEVTNA